MVWGESPRPLSPSKPPAPPPEPLARHYTPADMRALNWLSICSAGCRPVALTQMCIVDAVDIKGFWGNP